ncbi:MAG TPA: PD-(D/E)XK nuclease family protein [Candidatus Paceibacterota bacterium]|nr:PD-(D/E)XK nuclease family protein [Candidatus Paceibacterota bacterium]
MTGVAYTRRSRSQFDPSSKEPFTVSRSKIDLFSECPRCAFLDLKLGVKRPSGPAFTLNNAVDELLKREFDIHRADGTAHPLMQRYGLDAVPLADDRLDEWRDALRRGISYLHASANILVRGGIDDVWTTPAGELIIVDYKATAKREAPATEDDLYDSYKRQMEIYQWLFRRNGFTVSPTGYFVYANGKTDAAAFDGKLEFDIALIPYAGSDEWVEPAVVALKEMLMSEEIPPIGTAFGGGPCDFCTYRENAGKALLAVHHENKKKR